MTDVRLLVGTYPAAGPGSPPGQGEGIWVIHLDPATGALSGQLAVRTPAPSFLAVRGGTLLASGETVPGRLTRFALAGGGAFTEREAIATGGAEPCHVRWHPAGRAAYVTNYGSGSVSVVPVADDAEPHFASGVAQVFEHSGRGPDADRQAGPHAHATLIAPGGQHLLAADLGTDEIRRYRISRDGRLTEDGLAAVLPPGTGPRHMAVGPGGHVYVVGELDVTLHVLRWTADRLEPVQVLPACATSLRTGHRVLPAHVAVADDWVLVSVRGSDVIARFAVRDGGTRLVHESDLDAGGGWPRHFAVVGEWVVAALQNSDRVVSVRWRDPNVPGTQGRAGDIGAALSVPVPACVVPQRPLSPTSPAHRYVPPARVADNR